MLSNPFINLFLMIFVVYIYHLKRIHLFLLIYNIVFLLLRKAVTTNKWLEYCAQTEILSVSILLETFPDLPEKHT